MKIIFFTFLLFTTDQLSKIYVRGFNLPWFSINHNGLDLGETKPIINDFLHITLVENPGIAFGITPATFLKELVLIFTILLCLGFIGFLLLAKNADNKLRLSVSFILAGAAGNLFDRVFYGYFYNYAPLFQGNVVDFLEVKILNLFMFINVPGNYIFNFADLSITVGISILIFLVMKERKGAKDLFKQFAEERQDTP